MSTATIEKTINVDKGEIELVFPDDRKLTFLIANTPMSIKITAALDSIGKKLQSTARTKGFDETAKQIAQLNKGQWSARGEGGQRVSQVVEALARLGGKTTEQSQALWDSLTDEKKQSIRADNTVKAMMVEIKREKNAGADQVDVGSLFADMAKPAEEVKGSAEDASDPGANASA